jgi:hypothetical protein
MAITSHVDIDRPVVLVDPDRGTGHLLSQLQSSPGQQTQTVLEGRTVCVDYGYSVECVFYESQVKEERGEVGDKLKNQDLLYELITSCCSFNEV